MKKNKLKKGDYIEYKDKKLYAVIIEYYNKHSMCIKVLCDTVWESGAIKEVKVDGWRAILRKELPVEAESYLMKYNNFLSELVILLERYED